VKVGNLRRIAMLFIVDNNVDFCMAYKHCNKGESLAKA
jgi:hypothetical protein